MKNDYKIYWLISEDKLKTYVGFSPRLEERLREHRNKKVKSTKDFGNFRNYILEEVRTLKEARKKEKYWKSHAGRKKLKQLFKKI